MVKESEWGKLSIQVNLEIGEKRLIKLKRPCVDIHYVWWHEIKGEFILILLTDRKEQE